MKRTILSVVYVASVILFISACSGTKKTTMPEEKTSSAPGMNQLGAGDWKLIELEGKFIPMNSKAMLSFTAAEKNSVTGNAGCNHLNGSFELAANNAIKFSPLATTRMACFDENASSTETKFLAALARITNWVVTDGKLSLSDSTTVLAKFIMLKRLSNDEAKLNATWELNYISGPKIAFEGLYPTKKPTLIFNLAESEVSGNSSCNGFGAKVKIDGSAISFTDPIGTMMACPGEGEQVFYKTLKTITSYKVDDDNTLSLMANDIPVMRFSRK